jgi:2,3-bisphosphoglycerate-dependent phosphoglycerate mutase
MTRLVLIRHGEAMGAVDQIVADHNSCQGLSPKGFEQAEKLRERLARTGELADAAVLYASILPRAIQTAEAIAPAVGGGGLTIDQHCDLCEIHQGEADGLTWEEFREKYEPAEWSPETQHRPWAPGGESWAEFTTRVGRQLWELVRNHEGETIAIACHGGVIGASFQVLGNVPMWRPFELQAENTSLTEWTREPGRERWMLVRYNDAAHLL